MGKTLLSSIGLHPVGLQCLCSAQLLDQRKSLESPTETSLAQWMGELACLKQGPRVTPQHVQWMAWQAGQGGSLCSKMKNSIEAFEEISRKQNKKTKEVENRKANNVWEFDL